MMTKPIQSSTGGDALREQIEKIPHWGMAEDRMGYFMKILPSGDFVRVTDILAALAAPPLIKQEAETPQFIPVHGWEIQATLSTMGNDSTKPQMTLAQCDELANKLNKRTVEVLKLASKKEVVAPVGEPSTSGIRGLLARWRDTHNCGSHRLKEPYMCALCKDTEAMVDALFLKKTAEEPPVINKPVGDCACLPDWVANGVHQHGCKASSVSGPSEGLREAAGKLIADWRAYTKLVGGIATSAYHDGIRLCANELEALLAQSAAGTKPDPSLPLPEDDEGVRR